MSPLLPSAGMEVANITPIATLKSISILVVDDDPPYLRVVGMYLLRRGYSVFSASSGAAAIELAGKVEVAIVDMIMPGLDGLATIAQLSARNPELKIIASSGCSESEFRADLDRLGVEHFLAKPFGIERLTKILGEQFAQAAA